MQSTNSTSLHYREHTQEQDGWTVLAPPPAAAELPPPYATEDNSMPAAAPVAPAATLPFQIPTNSNIIGAIPITQTRKYARDVPFAVAFPEICNTMGLASSHACIGYKWDNERVNVPVHQLWNAADWTNCLESGIGMQSRVRTQTVICVIKNLNLPEETAPATSLAPSTSITASAKKRKSSANSPDGKKTFDFTQEYRQLKNNLECAMHKARCALCLMWMATIKRLTRSMRLSGPRKSKPPENIMFQDYFLPAPKRARNTRDTQVDLSTNPCAPTIHVTVNTGTSTGSSRLRPPTPTTSTYRRLFTALSPTPTSTRAAASATSATRR
ncbi:hypothetical protein B0H10DRAFT_1947052 [Mycena sp. CBHHK59/15]|nr:hypothetical protein B0H10DRAFT_1947052 [Mycena sp. CBHHK59/15]